MNLAVVTALTGLALLVMIVELLRRRQLREKYAMLWFVVGLVIIPLALFPDSLNSVVGFLGMASAVSLVLFVGIVFLLLVCMHLSWEVSRLEEETRTIAEDLALLRAQTEERAQVRGGGPEAQRTTIEVAADND